MMPNVLDAAIRIRPDVRQLRRDMDGAGKAVDRELSSHATKTGKKVGKELGKEAERGLTDNKGRLIKSGRKVGEETGDALADGFEKQTRRMSADSIKRMNDIGNKMTVGVTVPIVAGMAKMVQEAGDLNETVAATDQIFGTAAGGMQTWGDQALDNVGLAKQTVLEAANAMGAMFTGMGVAEQDAAKLTRDLIERGRDLSMLFNVSSDEMLTAIRSGMSGEMEPMKRFGVILSETAVKAEAVASGLVQASVSQADLATSSARLRSAQEKAAEATKKYGAESTEAQSAQAALLQAEEAMEATLAGKVGTIDQATLVQARYQLLMKQSQTAAGQYRREEDSLAATTERTREQFKQLSGEMGQSLIPIATRGLEVLGKVADVFMSMPGPVQDLILVLAALSAGAGPILKTASSLMTLIAKWNAVTVSANGAAAAQARAAAAGSFGGAGGFGKAAGKAGIYGLAAYGGFEAGKWIAEETGLGDWIANSFVGDWMIKQDWLPGMASGGTATPDGRIIRIAEGGVREHVLSDPQLAEIVGLSRTGGADQNAIISELRAMRTELQHLASGTGPVTVMNARDLDARALADRLDQLARKQGARRTRTDRPRL